MGKNAARFRLAKTKAGKTARKITPRKNNDKTKLDVEENKEKRTKNRTNEMNRMKLNFYFS